MEPVRFDQVITQRPRRVGVANTAIGHLLKVMDTSLVATWGAGTGGR